MVAWLWSASARSITQSKRSGVTPRVASPAGMPRRRLSAASSSARSAPSGSPIAAFSRASLSPTSAALKRSTSGIRIAFSVPWCSFRSCRPPSAWLSEWTAPRPFWKERPPSSAPIIISVRAARSPPSAQARSRLRQMRPAPSRAIASAGGLSRGERKVSMQCDSASRPVAAVRPGGRPSVSSGSQIARFGIRCGLMKPSLRPSARVSSAARPTSAPVPAVVGIAMTGATAGADAVDAAVDRRIVLERAGVGREQRHALGEVDRRAAAERDDAVAGLGALDRERAPAPRPRSGWAACRGSAGSPAAGARPAPGRGGRSRRCRGRRRGAGA